MLLAKNEKGDLINIIHSVPKVKYFCPICGERLIRNFGVKKQYFSHKKGLGENCELKMQEKIEEDINLTPDNIDILNREFFKKKFNNIKTEMSDYKSEEDYFLTSEQTKIIFSTESKIKISATAGSSKTTTLYYYAKERPNKRILYLVYNAAMKKEAEKTFGKLSNVTIKTVHGLAYGYIGWQYKNKLTTNYSSVDILNDLGLMWNDRNQELAVKIYALLNEYMLSDKQTFEEMDLFNDEDNKNIKKDIYKYAEEIWSKKADLNSSVTVEHDFYLKLFHLMKKDLGDKFDIVMLDESQDSNLLTFDLVKNLGIKGIVMVGDPYQQMYAWRRARDIMKLFKGKQYNLSTSFRVSQNTANIANILIKEVFNKDLGMKGFNSKQKIITDSKFKPNEKYTCIARTNATLFEEALDLLKENKKIFFEGGFNSYKFNDIRDGYYFSIGRYTNNPIFKKFNNYYQMKDFAENTEDVELLSLIRAIDKYGSEIPYLIESIRNNTCKSKEQADIILTTAHKSKGETYTNVKICDDFASMSEYFKKKYLNINSFVSDEEQKEFFNKYYEETRILYVTITRAKGKIIYNEDLKRYLILRYMFFNKKEKTLAK